MMLDPNGDRMPRRSTHIPAPARVARPDPRDSGGPIVAEVRAVVAASVVGVLLFVLALAVVDAVVWGGAW